MIGIILVALSAIFHEIGTSVGKYEVAHKKESLYGMGFLSAFWAAIFLLSATYFFGGEFVFSLESLPTFIARAVLEIILLFVALHAVVAADRSTFSFLRILTIPLLLAVDVFLGYSFSVTQVIGISIIVIALIFLLLNHGLSPQGKFLSLLSAVLAVGTISLYKYDISHFNSVAAEQGIMYIIIIVTLVLGAKINAGENVFRYFKHKVFFFQSMVSGVASLPVSFAYLFAPASVIATANRSFEIFTAMLSGKAYFREKHIAIKLTAFLLTVAGIVLIVL